MAEKEVLKQIKLQIEAGKATPAPPVGPALGSSGVNIMQFVKEFNDRTANQPGMIIPVVITVHKDKSFEFITKVPPVAVLIKKAIKKLSDLSKLVNVIIFEPKDSLMFSDAPLVRRNYIDVNLSKKSDIYLENLMIFEKLLRERNAILKSDDIDYVQLNVITEQLVDVEETICKYRMAYISEINSVLSKIVSNIKGENEQIKLEYLPFVRIDTNFKEIALQMYKNNEESDIKHKATQLGIHREDFKMILNGADISQQGSQGENRIAVIALKIAPYFLIEDEGKKPIIILDDVMSELDQEHKLRLVTFLRSLKQVFITSTNTTIKNASVYEVKEHNVTRRNAKW